MTMILAIALGGGIGSVARHYASAAFSNGFPYGTLFVNVLGSLLIGALVEIMALKWDVSLEIRAFLVTGFLGGFTTFSAFSLDVLKLAETNQYFSALAYVALSVTLSLAAAFAAMHTLRAVLS